MTLFKDNLLKEVYVTDPAIYVAKMMFLAFTIRRQCTFLKHDEKTIDDELNVLLLLTLHDEIELFLKNMPTQTSMLFLKVDYH